METAAPTRRRWQTHVRLVLGLPTEQQPHPSCGEHPGRDEVGDTLDAGDTPASGDQREVCLPADVRSGKGGSADARHHRARQIRFLPPPSTTVLTLPNSSSILPTHFNPDPSFLKPPARFSCSAFSGKRSCADSTALILYLGLGALLLADVRHVVNGYMYASFGN